MASAGSGKSDDFDTITHVDDESRKDPPPNPDTQPEKEKNPTHTDAKTHTHAHTHTYTSPAFTTRQPSLHSTSSVDETITHDINRGARRKHAVDSHGTVHLDPGTQQNQAERYHIFMREQQRAADEYRHHVRTQGASQHAVEAEEFFRLTTEAAEAAERAAQFTRLREQRDALSQPPTTLTTTTTTADIHSAYQPSVLVPPWQPQPPRVPKPPKPSTTFIDDWSMNPALDGEMPMETDTQADDAPADLEKEREKKKKKNAKTRNSTQSATWNTYPHRPADDTDQKPAPEHLLPAAKATDQETPAENAITLAADHPEGAQRRRDQPPVQRIPVEDHPHQQHDLRPATPTSLRTTEQFLPTIL